MSVLEWDKVGERQYETGVDHGVLYIPNNVGVYETGYAWNGLVSVTESPSGAESNKQYADNIAYLNLLSAEEFGGTLEAFTWPDAWNQCDGTAVPTDGVMLGQQGRKGFGLSYRTKIGTDLDPDAGYKLHLVWSGLAAPSEKAYTTINDSPEAITFSWELSTTPTAIGVVDGVTYKPLATITIDSRKVDPASLEALEEMLYGTVGSDATLPTPAEVVGLFMVVPTEVTPAVPTYVDGTDTLTVPGTTGVVYRVNGVITAAGPLVITTDVIVKASPAVGYKFPAVVAREWFFHRTP